jgi:phosphate transport system permease protein
VTTALVTPPPAPAAAAAPPKGPRRRATSLFAAGEAQVWVTGGALVLCVLMIVGLISLVVVQGGGTFWPGPLVQVETAQGKTYLGEIAAEETYRPESQAFETLPPEKRSTAEARVAAAGGESVRRMLRSGNFELSGTHYTWVSDFEIARETRPEWAVVVERLEWGRFYGIPTAFLLGEEIRTVEDALGDTYPAKPRPDTFVPAGEGSAAAWALFERHHEAVRDRWARRVRLETEDSGRINRRKEKDRLSVRRIELEIGDERVRKKAERTLAMRLDHEEWEVERREYEARAERARSQGRTPPEFAVPEPPRADAPLGELGEWADEVSALEAAMRAQRSARKAAEIEFRAIRRQIDALNAENARYVLEFATADGQEKRIPLAEIVRAYPPNRLDTGDRLGVYVSRWGEFLTDKPRDSNAEGGVLPAIFGTVVMTLIMSLLVVPFGVLAALYLREYAKSGPLVSLVRIAINNLAGVPSIVFGVFGLGFFCYTIGAGIDDLLFAERAPKPTFGTGGLLWASLTLALLTLPVVIVATEEALSAVPRSMREGSYACGASKWQTIRRIVLPRAMPGIMTGMILAIARGAGEVAPLMLVGVVKSAPDLPVDGQFPYLHLERSFMHLGFHIYDAGFQSQNSEAAKPLVFTTTLLLIGIVVLLNVVAIWVRSRLRRKFSAGQA